MSNPNVRGHDTLKAWVSKALSPLILEKNYKRGKKDAKMTSTPFDPDDDAEDIVKVLKKTPPPPPPPPPILFVSFFSFFVLVVARGLENNRARNPYRERILLSPLDVL